MSDRDDKRYIYFLYAGFGLLLAAFIFLSFTYFMLIISSNDELKAVTKNNDKQLHAAMTMRVSVRERAILLWHMTLSDDTFIRDELYQQFNVFGTNYAYARQQFNTGSLKPNEKQLLILLDKETRQRAPALRQFAIQLVDDVNEASLFTNLDTALSDQVVVSGLLDKIIQLQLKQNEIARIKSADKTSTIIQELIFWLLLFVLSVAIFARKVVSVANKQSRRLRKANVELSSLARHDHLTGLPNRLYLLEHLETTVSRVIRNKAHGAILYIDLDEFKPINDTYGHETGDAFLQTISQAITGLLRDSDVLARIGGDEFVVMLSEIATKEDAVLVANKLLGTLAKTFTLGGIKLKASASIGICYFPNGNLDADRLITCADKAMYEAKQCGKNQYSIY